ncbi:hypothetical protein [Xylanimonas protaetiae]|nr:hypothetical protein [Xylanimonas protaetiae]
MGQDDDDDCAGHAWRLVGVVLRAGETVVEYECVNCAGVMVEPLR